MEETRDLIHLFEPRKRTIKQKDGLKSEEIWSLIQVAAHPHPSSLHSIVKQLSIQHSARSKFLIRRPEVPALSPHTAAEETLNQVSVISLESVFELLRHVSMSNPGLLENVLATTDKCIRDLPSRCFESNFDSAGSWLEFLRDISASSPDRRAFKVYLCVAVLMNRVDLILPAVRQTLKAKIPDIETCRVVSDLQLRSLERYKTEKTRGLSKPICSFPTNTVSQPETLSIASDGAHLFVFNSGELHKYTTGLSGTLPGRFLKKVKVSANKLKLISASPTLLAIRTAKNRTLVSINKETLQLETSYKLDLSTESKLVVEEGRVLLARGSFSNLTLHSVDLQTSTVEDEPVRRISVTNPAVLGFGASVCDSEKVCHNLVNEDIRGISGTDSYTVTLNPDGKLIFRGNADEIGTGQGLVDKWREFSFGSINGFRAVACPHQEKYLLLISEDGKPYIAGHIKRGVDGDSSKHKKKGAPIKPKLLDRVKDRVVKCAAGNTTSAFVTEAGNLYLFGLLAQPFDSNGLVPQFSVLSVEDVSLGHNHAAILTKTGQLYTMGSNGQGQCGRNFVQNPEIGLEEEESDSEEGMCEPGTHVWRNILCMMCMFCGECTGYGVGCCRNGEQGRDPGLECGCGAGDSGCSICGCCRSCAKEAALIHRKHHNRSKIPKRGVVKPVRFESDDSDKTEDSEDEAGTDEEDENRAGKANTDGEEADTRPVHPSELTKLPAPVKLPLPNASVKQISCGLHHTVMILESGEVYGFGSNATGQLGLGSVAVATVPTEIQGVDLPAEMVACGATHTVVLANKQVYSCGKYMDGQLGRCPSDYSKDSLRPSDASLTAKGWYSHMCRVPGFGKDRLVVSIAAVGNRTFIKCRTPLIDRPLDLEDDIELIQGAEGLVVCVPDETKPLSVISSRATNQWKVQDTEIGPNHVVCYDELYRILWTVDKKTGNISGHTRGNLPSKSLLHRPLAMLPYTPSDVTKEALCYGILSHVAALANPSSALENSCAAGAKEDVMSLCNRFPSFGGGWGYSGKSVDAILFTIDTDILLQGIGLYGGRGNYTAKVKLFEVGFGGPEPDDGDLIFEMPSFNFSCKPKDTHQVLFDEPVHCVAGTWYRIIVKIEGPASDCGNSGKREVTVDGVKLSFRSSKRSTNGTDYGSGQIPQLLFKMKEEPEVQASSARNSTDIMPLGCWSTGFEHLLGIIKLGFTKLHTYIKTKKSDPEKLNRSGMSLNLTQSSDQSVPSVVTVAGEDARQTSIETMLCVTLEVVDIYLTVAPTQPPSAQKDGLLQECQDILLAVLKLSLPPETALVKRVTKVYSRHFHLFYKNPQMAWAVLLVTVENAKCGLSALAFSSRGSIQNNPDQNASVLSTTLLAMCHQADFIANEMFHYGTLTGLISPKTSQMSLGSQESGDPDGGTDLMEALNGVTYTKAIGEVITLALASGSVGISARKFLRTLLQQVVLVSLDLLGPLSVAANKNTPTRFGTVNLGSWNAKGKADAISFKTPSSNVFLSGIAVYQTAKDTSCDVEILVKDSEDKWVCLLKHSGQVKRGQSKGLINRIIFKKPLPITADVFYSVKVQCFAGSLVHGESTEPLTFVTGPDGTSFFFTDCSLSSSGTGIKNGQIPYLIYKTQLNQEIQECVTGNEKYETVTLQLLELVTSAFVKLVEKSQVSVPVAWGEDMYPGDSDIGILIVGSNYSGLVGADSGVRGAESGVTGVSSSDHLSDQQEEDLPEFLMMMMSYSQLILLNKSSPRSSYLLLETILKPLLAVLSEYNHKGRKGKDPEDTETVIVESAHPYPEGTVLHYQAKLSDSVCWMLVEFGPESGIGPEDSLQLFLNKAKTGDEYMDLCGNDGNLKSILHLTSSRAWPKRAILLPGNAVSFLLKSVTKANKQQLNDSTWGFLAKVTGYRYKTSKGSLSALEHAVADLAATCVRVMISPTSAPYHNLSQEGQYAFKSHSKLLSRGLYLSSLPSYQALRKRSFLHEESKKMIFLRGFMAGNQASSGGRLATWLDPVEQVDIARVHVELGVYDGELAHYAGTVYPVICCTLDKDGNIIFPLGAKVSVSVTRVDFDNEETSADPGGCFEEDRFNISRKLRLPKLKDAKSYNNGFYSVTWQPEKPGVYELTVHVDSNPTGSPVKVEVEDRKTPVIRTQRSEELLSQYKRKRKSLEPPAMIADTLVQEFEVVKCGAGGHSLRGAPSTSSSPIGLLAKGHTLSITKTIENSEGLWGQLVSSSVDLFCSVKSPSAFVLISSPFTTFLAPATSPDPNQVFILRTKSRQDQAIPPAVVFEHPSSGSSSGKSSAKTKSDYSISFLSDTSLVDDIEVRCVNSTALTNTIRTVYASYLWHYGAVDDAMAAAAYIKFESNGISDHGTPEHLRKHNSTPTKINEADHSFHAPGSMSGGTKKRSTSYNTRRLSEGDETGDSPSSLTMLCTLWDSVKDLIMTCATTKLKPSTPVRPHSPKETRPRKRKSKKGLKTQASDSPVEMEMCDLCGEKVPSPVTYHISKHHPGCRENSGGMGYNGKGIYCSGWSGLCGDGGKGLCTWYLLCTDCVDRYKDDQEPLLNNNSSRDDHGRVDGAPNIPIISTTDLEEQLRNIHQNALFLLSLAPIVQVSTPDHLDFETFLEEAMDTDKESARHKFRSLQACDSVLNCLSPMTPMSPAISRFPGGSGGLQANNKMVRSFSVNILPSTKEYPTSSSKSRPQSAKIARKSDSIPELPPLKPYTTTHVPEPKLKFKKSHSIATLPIRQVKEKFLLHCDRKKSNLLHNPSPKLKKLAMGTQLNKGPLFAFMSQKEPLVDLEEELIRGVEKAWSVSQGLLAADWLLRTVSSLPVLHSVLWRLYMGLLSDPATCIERRQGLLPICRHPTSRSIACYNSCVSAAFRTLMQSLSDLLPRLPPGSDLQKIAISCWNLEFRSEDHKFLQDCQVFSHIHRLLTSASRREPPVTTPNFLMSRELEQLEISASSREALIPYLIDKKTDTFWESGDKENWLSVSVPSAAGSVHAVAIHLDNDEDRGFVTTQITLKVGSASKVLKVFTQREVGARHKGWIWLEVAGYSHLHLEFVAKSEHVRVRQLVVYGGMESVAPVSTIPSSQQYALQVFRVLTNDILKNLTKEENAAHTSADLQEHLVSILFEQSHLTETQNKVLLHVVNAIRKQTLAISDKSAFNDDYCFELLSLVSALSGSAAGSYNIAAHESLVRDVFRLLHLGTKRIQRQVILLLKRILPHISPEKLGAVTHTVIPAFPHEEQDGSKRTVLNLLLAYVMKSVKLIVKSKGTRCVEEYTRMDIAHSDYWVQGTVAPELAVEVVSLLKEMVQGRLGSEWKDCAYCCLGYIVLSLPHIPEDQREESRIAQNRSLWLALAALSVMDEDLMGSLSVAKEGARVEYCENHEDGRTKALITCSKCGYLCADCDKYLHLNKRAKSHQRQVFKAAESSVVLSKHETMCRAKLYWLMAVVDTLSNKAVIEFRNTYSTRTDALVCRFCNEVGEQLPDGGCVCKNEECISKYRVSCKRTLPCGHICNGNMDEESCLPCLKNCSGDVKQDADDMCVICFTESLGCAPCVQLACGHVLHTTCISTVVQNRWIGPRITFSFLHCPICKTLLGHEYLQAMLQPLLELKEDVERKSVMRLKYDGISFDTDAEAVEYAMHKYAYYQCYKCTRAYFGGEAQCQAEAGDEFDPADLVCGGCSNLSQEVCPKHGTDYLEYKCRYCCSVAVYFCFGSTHFCTPCHDDFVRLRSISKDALPACPVGPKATQLEGSCPLGVDHPATGEEFALGCGVCRNVQTF